jgi:hypothetical protein
MGWIIVALIMAIGALFRLWKSDYSDAAFDGMFAIYFAVQAQGSPPEWWSVGQWWLITLLAALRVVRVMRWTGFL